MPYTFQKDPEQLRKILDVKPPKVKKKDVPRREDYFAFLRKGFRDSLKQRKGEKHLKLKERVVTPLKKPWSISLPHMRIQAFRFPHVRFPHISFGALISFKKVVIVMLGVFIAGFGLFGYRVLPRATVEIYPVVYDHTISTSFEWKREGKKDRTEPSLLPISLEPLTIEIEAENDFLTTGKEDRLEKARGSVTVYNAYSVQPQTLVKTTRFVSEGGHLFRSIQTIIVPGAKIVNGKLIPSSADVEVIAGEPGSAYNIGPSTFSIPGFAGTPKYLGFYGKSKAPMSGGMIGEASVVSLQDLADARRHLEEKMDRKVKDTIAQSILEGFEFIEGTAQTDPIIFTFSAKAKDAAVQFHGKAHTILTFFVVQKQQKETFVDAIIGESLPSSFEELKAQRQVRFIIKEISADNTRVQGEINVITKRIAKFDEHILRSRLVGQDEAAVRTILMENQHIERAVISFWPFWVKKVPPDPGRVSIVIHSSLSAYAP